MTAATFSADNAPLSPAPCCPSEGTRFPSRTPGSQPRLPAAVPAAETANKRLCQTLTHRPPQPEQPEDKPQTRGRGPEPPQGLSPTARAGLRGPWEVPAHPKSPLLRVLGPLLPWPRGAADHHQAGADRAEAWDEAWRRFPLLHVLRLQRALPRGAVQSPAQPGGLPAPCGGAAPRSEPFI